MLHIGGLVSITCAKIVVSHDRQHSPENCCVGMPKPLMLEVCLGRGYQNRSSAIGYTSIRRAALHRGTSTPMGLHRGTSTSVSLAPHVANLFDIFCFKNAAVQGVTLFAILCFKNAVV